MRVLHLLPGLMAEYIRTGKADALRYQARKETQYLPHTMYRNRQVDNRLTSNMFCYSIYMQYHAVLDNHNELYCIYNHTVMNCIGSDR